MQDYVQDASDYMGRTTSAFEAMTANMHFLTQGLLEINDAIQKQNQVLNLQTNVLGGIGDRDSQLKQLMALQSSPAQRAKQAEPSPTGRWADLQSAQSTPQPQRPEAGAGF